jgi:hypothetical protein
MASWPSRQFFQYDHVNRKTLPVTSVNDTRVDIELYSVIDDIFCFSFKVPYLNDNQVLNQIYFARYDKGPVDINRIPVHTSYGVRTCTDLSCMVGGMTDCDYRTLYSSRLVTSHPVITVLILFAHILVMALCFALRNVEPLKSRRGIPIFVMFCSYLNILLEGFSSMSVYETKVRYNCILTMYMTYPTILVGVIFPTLVLIRFYAMINLNIYRSGLVLAFADGEKQQNVAKMPRRYRILSRLTSPLILGVVATCVLLLYGVIMTILGASYKFQCIKELQTAMRIIYMCFGVFFGLIIVGFQISDIYINFRLLIRCRLNKFFRRDDPFFFRLETLSTAPLLLLVILWATIPLPIWIKATLGDIVLFMFLWIAGVFSLVVVIIQWLLKQCNLHREYEDVLKLSDVLLEKELYETFFKFARREWTYESLLLKKDIMEYKKLAPVHREGLAQVMVGKYLTVDESPLEVNAPKRVLDVILQNIHSSKFEEGLFNDLERTVDTNLSDSFERFKTSSEFKKYLDAKKSKMEIIKTQIVYF